MSPLHFHIVLYQLLKNVNLDVCYFLNLDVLLKPSMEELYQTELRNKKKNKKKFVLHTKRGEGGGGADSM